MSGVRRLLAPHYPALSLPREKIEIFLVLTLDALRSGPIYLSSSVVSQQKKPAKAVEKGQIDRTSASQPTLAKNLRGRRLDG